MRYINWMKSAYIGTEYQSNVYAAEMMGLVLASALAIRKRNSVSHVTIFTDNHSAIDTIRNPGQQSGEYILKQALKKKFYTSREFLFMSTGYPHMWALKETRK